MLELGIFDDSPHVQLTIPSHSARIAYGEQVLVQATGVEHPRLHGIDLVLEFLEQTDEKRLKVTNCAST